MNEATIALHPDEQKWLEDYKRSLDECFPGLVDEMVLFGSKARGDAKQYSDLDLLLIIDQGNKQTKKEMRYLGYDLSIGNDVVPSIQIYTKEEREQSVTEDSAFFKVIDREGVAV